MTTEGEEMAGMVANSDWRLSSGSSRDSRDPAANRDELTLREFDIDSCANTAHKLVMKPHYSFLAAYEPQYP